MKQPAPIPLKKYNSFAVNPVCENFYEPTSISDLQTLVPLLPNNTYILGEGSNTLFIDKVTPAIVKPKFLGIKAEEHDEYFLIKAGASENWHSLVEYCVDRNIYGLENLALIPGSVGAAPVQNIGAYGVEFSDYCEHITWFDFSTLEQQLIPATACEFGYRTSCFKNRLKGKGIILSVTLKLPKAWTPRISYTGLDTLSKNATAIEVMVRVIAIRQSKLPDPDLLPNAGSFFKNPIITNTLLAALLSQFPSMPFYEVDKAHVKVAAGWLIEQAGLKGVEQSGVGVHKNQALVLVNFSSEFGYPIILLAKKVIESVKLKFHIQLEPEVRIVSGEKEISIEELITHG